MAQFRVGYDKEQNGWLQKSDHSGYVVDIVNEAMRRIGLEFNETYYGSIEDCRIAANNSEVDGCFGMNTYRPDRIGKFNFGPVIYTKQLKMLMERPKEKFVLFGWLSPFSLDAWLIILAMMVLISFTLIFTTWLRKRYLDRDSKETISKQGIADAVYTTMGSLMGVESIEAPCASTRLIALSWYFFVLICIATYTANLAAFLTLTNMDLPVNDFQTLAKQTKLKYGFLEHSSVGTLFAESKIEPYQASGADVIIPVPGADWTNPAPYMQAYERIVKGDFTLLDSYLTYVEIAKYVGQNTFCTNLMVVGDTWSTSTYNVVYPPNAQNGPRKDLYLELEKALVAMRLEGYMSDRREKHILIPCDAPSKKSPVISSRNFLGVVVVTLTLIGLGILVLLLQIIHIKLAPEKGCNEVDNSEQVAETNQNHDLTLNERL